MSCEGCRSKERQLVFLFTGIHHLTPDLAFRMVKEEEDGQRRKDDSKQTHAVIDRIEDGGMAVLLVGEDGRTQVDVPVSLLPGGASGGDHLLLTIAIDSSSRTRARARIKGLQEELKQQSGAEDKKDFKL